MFSALLGVLPSRTISRPAGFRRPKPAVGPRVVPKELLFGCSSRIGYPNIPSFLARFAPLENMTSFVFNDFLASFPLFLCFLRRFILPATRPIRFFLSASKHRDLPCDNWSIIRWTMLGYHDSRFLSS